MGSQSVTKCCSCGHPVQFHVFKSLMFSVHQPCTTRGCECEQYVHPDRKTKQSQSQPQSQVSYQQ